MMKRYLAAGALLAVLLGTGAAYADQPGSSVSQTATHLDAATFWQGQANGATSCNTVSQTAANDTITITPPSGQYVYVTELIVQNSTDATGVTQTGTILVGGVQANSLPANLSFASALTTVQGFAPPMIIPFNPPLRGSTPGVAVTFTPSATQSAHNFLCMSALGYFNNN